ncbi:hypothetical protein ACE02P_09555 [Shewanella bicestrii]
MTQHINTSGTNHEVASWIWHNLVPQNGQSNTVQGELLRAVEKLRWEAQENGNINWDNGFLILIAFLENHLLNHPGFSEAERKVIKSDLSRLKNFLPVEELDDEADSGSLPYVEDDLYDRLESFVVSFARTNPQTIPNPNNPSLHR